VEPAPVGEARQRAGHQQRPTRQDKSQILNLAATPVPNARSGVGSDFLRFLGDHVEKAIRRLFRDVLVNVERDAAGNGTSMHCSMKSLYCRFTSTSS
jgi:hypothetical protein